MVHQHESKEFLCCLHLRVEEGRENLLVVTRMTSTTSKGTTEDMFMGLSDGSGATHHRQSIVSSFLKKVLKPKSHLNFAVFCVRFTSRKVLSLQPARGAFLLPKQEDRSDGRNLRELFKPSPQLCVLLRQVGLVPGQPLPLLVGRPQRRLQRGEGLSGFGEPLFEAVPLVFDTAELFEGAVEPGAQGLERNLAIQQTY